MNKAFYDKVINLIPSRDLKDHIKAHNFEFAEKDLLKFVLDYARPFWKRMELLSEASRVLKDKSARKLAKKRIAIEEKRYSDFMREGEEYVYEIKIKLAPNAPDEGTFITKTFDGAITVIKSFLKHYRIKAKEQTGARYIITKKDMTVPVKPRDISKVGDVGQIVLDKVGDTFRTLELYWYRDNELEPKCPKDLICEECQRCIEVIEPHFPHFIESYELVAFYDDLLYDPSHLTYGIFVGDLERDDAYSEVLLIEDNKYIAEKNIEYRDEKGFYRVYDAHCHPSLCEVIKPDIDTVPKDIYEKYLYAVDGLKRIDYKE